jgi:hypothetical protein
MKRALQGLLIAGESMKNDTLSGEKCITIREGHRDYTLGPVLIGCHILNWATLKTITSVKYTTLGEVTQEEWEADGTSSLEELKAMLRAFYPDIDYNSEVTVICWN